MYRTILFSKLSLGVSSAWLNDCNKIFIENLPMTDYYKMISGDMAYIDLVDEDTDILYSYIKDFKKEELNLPSYFNTNTIVSK